MMNVHTQAEQPITLREIRIRAGLSLAALAKAAGYVSPASVRACELGAHPTLDRALCLARALEITPQDLLAAIDAGARARQAAPVAEKSEEGPAD